MTIPCGLLTGTAAAMALVWGLFAIDPGRNLVSSGVQTALYAGLLVLTVRSRRVKVLLVRTVQRWTINPLMRLLLAIGIKPLGLAILETRGRTSGKPRRVPVGNGRNGDAFWIRLTVTTCCLEKSSAPLGRTTHPAPQPEWVHRPTRPPVQAP